MSDHVLIFGLGGIGSIYACLLQFSENCLVHVVARSKYKAVRDHGLKLISSKFGEHTGVTFAGVYQSCEEAAGSGIVFRYIICANKSILDAKPSLSEILLPVISTSTSIVLLQNGVGIEDPLHLAYPHTTIISAVVWTGGKVLPDEDGMMCVEQFWAEKLTIGVDFVKGCSPCRKELDRLELGKLVDWLKSAGGECEVTEDIQRERWIKVIWNAALNSITTLVRMRTGAYFASSSYSYPIIDQLLNEMITIARAKNINVPADLGDQLIQKCRDLQLHNPAGITTSMMLDNLAGRDMEVECILGAPLREAQLHEIKTPTLLTLYTLIKALAFGNAHPELRVDFCKA